MDTVTPMNVIVDNIIDMNDYFADVATGEGLAPLLVLAGTILIVVALGVFGILTLGAIGSLFSSSSS
ncbi:hypothetical protein [Natronolimnohabitans innermongolicus]|uniref:Uncharacterized protein n=1 Tax=Natronolimnohabitans innermongolicus JCM 12255 TaxID=1227499 RepID=L9WYM9_9EURY|nr:hypothetical protein [Natronolimnohabitans innermongolicus]ELY54291.1 hypothetical protein C493_12829 [Natronolimnohabitans innermongolicus JCM 12255]